LAKSLFETEPEIAPLPQTARQLDAALRAKIEPLLNAGKVWNLHSYGWVSAYDADPEFIGHAMWQTDPPFEHDHLQFYRCPATMGMTGGLLAMGIRTGEG
jgi:hypothetical protein